ncbi:MAG: hypothetical protein GXO35_06960, partial [Gammaproteobacteria bacterium]|nr:hypothetical protein [Gammaproteobacteria bacterium]
MSIVNSLTTIQIQLIQYTNEVGRRQDGKCCDLLCSTACDLRLTICLDYAYRYTITTDPRVKERSNQPTNLPTYLPTNL